MSLKPTPTDFQAIIADLVARVQILEALSPPTPPTFDLAVTDGTTTVDPTTTLDFLTGAQVSMVTGDVAGVDITPVAGMAMCGGVVLANGTVYSGNITATKPTTGVYQVAAPSSFDDAQAVVSPLNAYGGSSPISVAIGGYAGAIDNQTVQVTMADTSGNLIDWRFSIIIFGTIVAGVDYGQVVGVAGQAV